LLRKIVFDDTSSAIGRPREEWRQEVRFIILLVANLYGCTSRDVTVFLILCYTFPF
jgi:hypothetical protein